MVENAWTVSQTPVASAIQTANFSSHWRTTPMGPPTPMMMTMSGKHGCPDGVAAGPENGPGDDGRGHSHHHELEDRPPDELEDVQDRRDERPAHPEHRAQEHHGWRARRASHSPDEGEQEAARGAPDQDGQECAAQAEPRHEKSAGQHDQQSDSQVSPEHGEVHEAEHPVFPRNWLDPPFRWSLEPRDDSLKSLNRRHALPSKKTAPTRGG